MKRVLLNSLNDEQLQVVPGISVKPAKCPICHSSKNTREDLDFGGKGHRFSCDACNIIFWRAHR